MHWWLIGLFTLNWRKNVNFVSIVEHTKSESAVAFALAISRLKRKFLWTLFSLLSHICKIEFVEMIATVLPNNEIHTQVINVRVLSAVSLDIFLCTQYSSHIENLIFDNNFPYLIVIWVSCVEPHNSVFENIEWWRNQLIQVHERLQKSNLTIISNESTKIADERLITVSWMWFIA